MKTTEEFIKILLAEIPKLSGMYEEHLADYDEFLPHVFMADITRFVELLQETIANEKSEEVEKLLPVILQILEQALRNGDNYLQELVVISFLENLDYEKNIYTQLKSRLGAELLKHLMIIEQNR